MSKNIITAMIALTLAISLTALAGCSSGGQKETIPVITKTTQATKATVTETVETTTAAPSKETSGETATEFTGTWKMASIISEGITVCGGLL